MEDFRLFIIHCPIVLHNTDTGQQEREISLRRHFQSFSAETVFVNDRMVKHEVRAFLQRDETRPSYRDVIVNFFRKPHVDGTDKKMVEGEDGEMIEQTVY